MAWLWIKPDFSTASRIYGVLDVLEKHCIGAGSMLDKKAEFEKVSGCAHSLLWICSGLSTLLAQEACPAWFRQAEQHAMPALDASRLPVAEVSWPCGSSV
jgi:hypothetical protein